MTDLDPIEGKTKGDKTRNHDGTGSSSRETKGDKPGNHDGTGSSRRETKGDKSRQTWKA